MAQSTLPELISRGCKVERKHCLALQLEAQGHIPDWTAAGGLQREVKKWKGDTWQQKLIFGEFWTAGKVGSGGAVTETSPQLVPHF